MLNASYIFLNAIIHENKILQGKRQFFEKISKIGNQQS